MAKEQGKVKAIAVKEVTEEMQLLYDNRIATVKQIRAGIFIHIVTSLGQLETKISELV